MALSTPASGTRLGGGLRPPSEPSPEELRGQSPRSIAAGATGADDELLESVAGRVSAAAARIGWRWRAGWWSFCWCLIAIFADFLAPYSYTKTNFGRLNEAPTRDYPLGTDNLGRDLLSRMIYGARVSMLVGLGAQVIVVVIGVPIGALSGFVGGRTDSCSHGSSTSCTPSRACSS